VKNYRDIGGVSVRMEEFREIDGLRKEDAGRAREEVRR
jgi:hypothetical protein